MGRWMLVEEDFVTFYSSSIEIENTHQTEIKVEKQCAKPLFIVAHPFSIL